MRARGFGTASHSRDDGVPVLVASLDDLIRMKEAGWRTKDLLMATEYRVLADEINRREG